MQPPDSRCRIVRVSAYTVLELLNVLGSLRAGEPVKVIAPVLDLPENSTVVDVHYDPFCRCFSFIVHCPDWSLTADGGEFRVHVPIGHNSEFNSASLLALPESLDPQVAKRLLAALTVEDTPMRIIPDLELPSMWGDMP